MTLQSGIIGVQGIGVHIPPGRASNSDRLTDFGIEAAFLDNKIGVQKRAIMGDEETAVGMCLKAAADLVERGGPSLDSVECVVVVTQNPGIQIPHLSAQLHGTLGLRSECACFDVSLGCSGYVYGLAAIQAFMQQNGLRHGLLFTADPYSSIIDLADKNTALLFGDAATCTWIGPDPVFTTGKFTFGTMGVEHAALTCARNGRLFMNGRAIFNFAAKQVPSDITRLLSMNGAAIGDIDEFIFHQGSKYIVDTLAKLLQLDRTRVAFDMTDYGNTVSSSIPLILAKSMTRPENRRLVLSGFGAGLSWASALLTRPNVCS